ncbi:hypothetical protein AM609_11745 [Actinomyces sp. oral taxon 414]|uniref:FHA domain-containing protein n=2 Tax=Actinomyces TaxID=1654 RepID=UPI0006AFB4C3|nr:FHA domain-containing protein [Actinomyces sp. oral taxon 414]ALC99962.1 hypothetical protein AM609_11745 [Actinomyces sp. oral taxon 414]
MLQIGRYSYRGTGAVMVAGPLGVALVPPEWAKGAREALIGRAEIVAWLTQVSQAGADAAVLDLAGPQAHLSLLGRAWVRALAPGLAEAQEWQAPVWGWALNPGDWECLDVELGVAEAERTVGEWRLATEDLVDARSLRIGRALREETDRFERPFELPQAGASGEALGASRLAEYRDGEPGIPVRSRRAARARAGEPGGPGAQGGDEVVWSAADGESGRESAAAKPRHLWVPPDPTQPSGLRLRTRTRAAGPRHRRVSEVETEEALVEPVAQTPERALRRRGRRVAEPVARTPEQASGSAAPLRSPESAASPESTDTPVVGWAGPAGLAAPDAERPGPVEPVAGSADAASPEPAAGSAEDVFEPVGSAEVPAPVGSAASPEPAAAPVVVGSAERVETATGPAVEPAAGPVEPGAGPAGAGAAGSADSAESAEVPAPVGSAEVPAPVGSADEPVAEPAAAALIGAVAPVAGPAVPSGAGSPEPVEPVVEPAGTPGFAGSAGSAASAEEVPAPAAPAEPVAATSPEPAGSAASAEEVPAPVGSADEPVAGSVEPVVEPAGTPGSAGSAEPVAEPAGPVVAASPEPVVESAASAEEVPAPVGSADEPVAGSAGSAGSAASAEGTPAPAEPAGPVVAASPEPVVESAASPAPAGSAVEPGPGPADDAVEWPEPAEAADDAEAAVGAPWDMAEPDPEPLVEWTPFSPAEPFTNRRTDFFSQGLAASEPPANMSPAAYGGPEDNPELYEATLTPEALARMRQEQSATGDTIMRRVPDAVPTTPSAFLIYAGSAPVEVVRDVIIGRDPNTRVLTGRPMAAPLRVPSPGSEISRSHCAVMATAPGVWSLMDLASVNGSILVHPDGSSEDVPAMVGVPLADGDLIDLGEGVTVEFRVR